MFTYKSNPSRLIGILSHFGKYSYSLSYQERHEKIDTTFVSVQYIWSYSQQLVSSALHKDWKQEETPNLALSNGNKIHLSELSAGCLVTGYFLMENIFLTTLTYHRTIVFQYNDRFLTFQVCTFQPHLKLKWSGQPAKLLFTTCLPLLRLSFSLSSTIFWWIQNNHNQGK